jgi:porphobilinogen deaminase
VSRRVLIVGTRGSRLALEQTRRVIERLSGPSEVRVIKTSGDRFQDQKLGEQADVGFFTKEIEQELLSKQIDLAVHSLKDLPTVVPPGLVLGALLERAAAGDVLLVRPEEPSRHEKTMKNPGRGSETWIMRPPALAWTSSAGCT